MSVTVLPYISDTTTQELKKAGSAARTQTPAADSAAGFQTFLQIEERALQAMAVDALLDASGSASISVETIQKLLGFNPQTSTILNVTDETDAAETSSAGTGTSSSSGTLSCSEELESYFKEASEKYGVDINLLKAIAFAESGFDPSATSSAGAMGIMQLMPSTASSLGISDAYDARENIMGGAQIIAQNLEKYDGDLSLALAAYNAGSGNVDKYGGIPPFAETQNYVEKVLNYYENA